MAKASIWDQLQNISGSTTKTSRSGMSVRGAKQAGVTKDVMRPEIQALADSLQPPEEKLTAGAKRTMAALKKYNIAGETATVSPEVFRELFAKTSTLALLKNKGVKMIKIQSTSVDMSCELLEPDTKYAGQWDDIPTLPARDVAIGGIARAAGLETKLVLKNRLGIVGLLHVHHTDQALAKLSGQSGQGKIHTTEWTGQGNAMTIFRDSSTVSSAVYNVKKISGIEGGINLTHSFTTSAGQTKAAPIGTLFHPDRAAELDIDFNQLRKIQIQHVSRAIASSKANDHEKLVSDVFREAKNGYVLYSGTNYNDTPVAVFIPPKNNLGS